MIPVASHVSLDQEAECYRQACFQKVKFEPVILKPREEIQSYSYDVVCWKCGRPGHIAAKCDGNLPTLAELRASSEKDLRAVLKEKQDDPTLETDEFGFYSTAGGGTPIKTTHSWRSGRFCVNCGERDHRSNACPHYNMGQLFSDLKDVLMPHSIYSVDDIRQAFMDAWEL